MTEDYTDDDRHAAPGEVPVSYAPCRLASAEPHRLSAVCVSMVSSSPISKATAFLTYQKKWKRSPTLWT